MKNIWEVWPSALSADECDEIISKAQKYPEKVATVGFESTNRIDQNLRESSVRWFPPKDEPALVERIMGYVRSSNRTNFGFDLVSPFDIQFTEYHGTKNGKYDWHHDVRLNHQMPYDRKLSVVVQLSDRSSYEGGNSNSPPCSIRGSSSSRAAVFCYSLHFCSIGFCRSPRVCAIVWLPGWKAPNGDDLGALAGVR